MLVGVDKYMTKNDVLRAAMESACFQAHDAAEAMGRDLGAPVQNTRAGYAADVIVLPALCMPEDGAAAVREPRIAAGQRTDRTSGRKRAVRRAYDWAEPDPDRPGTSGNRFWTILPAAVGALALIVYFVYRK